MILRVRKIGLLYTYLGVKIHGKCNLYDFSGGEYR
jgi:hypothetical protein